MKLTALPLAAILLAGTVHAAPIDVLRFGDTTSERRHRLTAEHSEVFEGALGEAARRLLPLGGKDWRGGSLAFTLAVDPKSANYVTMTLWGGETNHDRLLLSCDGKQVGARHLGDSDLLDIGSVAPMAAGRFFHNTTPLPLQLTLGKQQLACRIDSTGAIWPYGRTFNEFQKPMLEATRGLYTLTIDTSPYLTAGALERKGSAPAAKLRPEPGPEVLDAVKRRVGGAIDALLAAERPLRQPEMLFLARAYDVAWTSAYRHPNMGALLVKGLDDYFRLWREAPEQVRMDPSTFNPGWFGLGQAAWALLLRQAEIAPLLDETILDTKGASITRREAYALMLTGIRDWQRAHRRFYTNQSMIVDTYGIYLANRGIALLAPAKAMPEQDALRYVYEAIGLEPWRGDDLPGGGHRFMAGGPDGSDKGAYRPGQHYYQITDKGLTRELGYVGNYGEVLDWVAAAYDATRPAADQPGDMRVRAQLIKIAHSRAFFRYPIVDAGGYRAMALETVIGWRDLKYPGDVVYAQRPSWDASPLEVAALTMDPSLVAYTQQMFADKQFFAAVKGQMATNSVRVNAGLLQVPGQYEALAKAPRVDQKLPMSEGEPDFVFSDEEDGVVAVKNGKEIFYASLYWRARNAVNKLAKVHHITPQMERMAVVAEEAQFTASGKTWTRPEELFGGHDARYAPFSYPETHTAAAGETLPIAAFPDDVTATYGDESPYAGKAEFYTLRYGPYTVVMNTTAEKSFAFAVPRGKAQRELVAKTMVAAGAKLVVAPRTTLVLYAGVQR